MITIQTKTIKRYVQITLEEYEAMKNEIAKFKNNNQLLEKIDSLDEENVIIEFDKKVIELDLFYKTQENENLL